MTLERRSSDDPSPNVHKFGDETLVDDGAADSLLRNSVVDVAPGEGHHPVYLYLDNLMLKKWQIS